MRIQQLLGELIQSTVPSVTSEEYRGLLGHFQQMATTRSSDPIYGFDPLATDLIQELQGVGDTEKAQRFQNLAGRINRSDWPLASRMLQLFTNIMPEYDLETKIRYLGINTPPYDVGKSEGETIERMILPFSQELHAAILSDMPFVLQGVDTANFKWHGYELELPEYVPRTLQQLFCEHLMEPALLYRYLNTSINDYSANMSKRKFRKELIIQAFVSAMQGELRNYLQVLGLVEARIKHDQEQSGTLPELTLRGCIPLLFESKLALRFMYTMFRRAQTVHGAVVSELYKESRGGEKSSAALASILLQKTCVPLNRMIATFMTSGEIEDPSNEFFVSIVSNSKWKDRFKLVEELVPVFIASEVAQRIFEVGKTLYYIRVYCRDDEWVNQRKVSRRVVEEDITVLRLSSLADECYDEVMDHLSDLLNTKYKLGRHLQGLKDYLLLAKGDFFQVLLEEASTKLEEPASTLYRHTVVSLLEGAVKSSNAQYDDPVVLDALDARILSLKHGQSGWEVFCLDYRLKEPLNVVILDEQTIREYRRIFNFLWRLKRVSYLLCSCSRRVALLFRGQHAKRSHYDDPLWQTVRRVHREMYHVIREIQHYISYEVIEAAWIEMQAKLRHKLTIDEIKKVHEDYLAKITQMGLLLGNKEVLAGEIHQTLRDAEKYSQALLELCKECEASRSGVIDPARTEVMIQNMNAIHVRFGRRITWIVDNLEKSNDDAKLLGVRLNFNRYYC